MADLFTDADVQAWINSGGATAATFIGLDLTSVAGDLAKLDLKGSELLGCRLPGALLDQARAQGALVLDPPGNLPFRPFRGGLYRVKDLYDQYDPADVTSWSRCFDYKCFEWFMAAPSKPRILSTAQNMYGRLHDTVQEAALAQFIGGQMLPSGQKRPVVGIMGGHDVLRTDATFRAIAEMSRVLCREGYLMVTGGGPGLMEAGNLGAFLAPFDDARLHDVLEILRPAPSYKDARWLETAALARASLVGSWNADEEPASVNLGVPTWLYGHEPPNIFATHAAKLFFNSLREDGLVTIAGGGIVFGRGNAGTVQEVFQDASQNYYLAAGQSPTPMALYEKAFWTRTEAEGPDPKERKKPVAALLNALAKEKVDFSQVVAIEDDPTKILDLIRRSTPIRALGAKAFAAEGPRKADLWMTKHGY